MIVVVGRPEATRTRTGVVAGGLASSIARAAAAEGRVVQLLARVPDDATGDGLLQSLAASGIGHVATLRSPGGEAGAPLEAADVELGLRYLSDVSVVVLAEPTDRATSAVAADAVAWSRGSLIAIVHAGAAEPHDLPEDATVLESPASDPDGAFASLVGGLAAKLDAGIDPATAFQATMAGRPDWTAVEG